jgi:hypothetical protein
VLFYHKKNDDVDKINFQIQQILPYDLMSFKSIDTTADENETVNFPTEFLKSLDIPATTQSSIEDWFTNYSFA